MMTDELLYYRIKDGDIDAFDILFKKYYTALCIYAGQYVAYPDAENIVQDLMLHLWENRKDFRIQTSLKSYLFVSVRNKCNTFYKRNLLKHTIRQVIGDKLNRTNYNNIDNLIDRTILRKTMAALNNIEPIFREAFMQNRILGQTFKEIAEEQSVSPKTIEYRVYKALYLLRQEMKDDLLDMGLK